MMTPAPPSFGVVVPAHNAEATLGACLGALLKAGFEPTDITVVDDGSRDGTGTIAQTAGVRVLRNPSPQRPAQARNRGADETLREVLLFVDADVVVHPDVRERLMQHFQDPSLTAVIGSYDFNPPATSAISRYRNLLHAYTHHRAAGEVRTFWTGLGAVRRSAFLAAGGFDPAWEDIEDVEFGLRLPATVLLDPGIKGTHLKAWTIGSMLRTDCRGRAVPWTRLLRSGREGAAALNASRVHRMSAAALLAALAALGVAVVWPPALWVSLLGGIAFIGTNLPLFRALARTGGSVFAVKSVAFHVLHTLAAAVGYARVIFFEKGGKANEAHGLTPRS
jgi:glycosyltransferase involved in cell wall biosynthesis